MIRVLIVLIALSGCAWVQMHYLAPVKTVKERVAFFTLMVLVAVTSSALILNINVPSPMSGIRGVFEPLGRSILH